MVGILLSYWDGLFLGAMLVSGRVSGSCNPVQREHWPNWRMKWSITSSGVFKAQLPVLSLLDPPEKSLKEPWMPIIPKAWTSETFKYLLHYNQKIRHWNNPICQYAQRFYQDHGQIQKPAATKRQVALGSAEFRRLPFPVLGRPSSPAGRDMRRLPGIRPVCFCSLPALGF